MKSNNLKISTKQKVAFLIVVFIFLFFGLEVSAAACNKPTDLQPWNKDGSCTVEIEYTDPGDGSGLTECFYKIITNKGEDTGWISEPCSGDTATLILTITINSDETVKIGNSSFISFNSGENAITVKSKAKDTAGNETPESEWGSQDYNIDAIKPVTVINSPPAGSCQGEPSFDVSISDSDTGGSSLDTGECKYRVISYDSGGTPTITKDNWSRTCGASVTLTVGPAGDCRHEGTNSCRIVAWSKDYASNQSDNAIRDFSIDWSDPYQIGWSPTSRDWANTDVSVTVQYADDGCGMDNVKYCWTTGSSCTPDILFPNTWGGSTTQSSNGSWNLCAEATDVADNSTTIECKGPYRIDKDAPETTIQCNGADCTTDWYNASLSITLSCQDKPDGTPNSGCDTTYYCRDTTNTCTPATVYTSAFEPISEGASYVRYFSTDVAGNQETTKSQTIKIDAPPTASVSLSPLEVNVIGQTNDVLSIDVSVSTILGLARSDSLLMVLRIIAEPEPGLSGMTGTLLLETGMLLPK
jgi:hypothetical protein